MQNLISSSFTASTSSAPTFTADTGYAGNGSSAYIDSNYNFSTNATNYSQNSGSLFAWSTEAAVDNGFIIGEALANDYRLGISPYGYGASVSAAINGAAISGAISGSYNTAGVGFYSASRTSGTQMDAYKNTTDVATSSSNAAGSVPNSDLVFLNSSGSFFNGGVAAGGDGAGLTAGDVSNLYSLLHTFLHAVNATTFP
jgi:hypothetical protein